MLKTYHIMMIPFQTNRYSALLFKACCGQWLHSAQWESATKRQWWVGSSVTFQGRLTHSTDPPDVQNANICPVEGGGGWYLFKHPPVHLQDHRLLTYAFIRPIPYCIAFAELCEIKAAVWMPDADAGRTARYLLWLLCCHSASLRSHQCTSSG